MITTTALQQPVQVRANVNAADLETLIGALNAASIVELPEGKTLADVTRLNITKLPTPLPDGTVAIINAALA